MDLTSVEKAGDEFLHRNLPLHILVNNAGIFNSPYHSSKQYYITMHNCRGIEGQFATNHFAPVVLTMKLISTLIASQPSRIVNLSSFQHVRATGVPYTTCNDKFKYDGILIFYVSNDEIL
jgi:NAD(P)-dependent dehydrogenase (short-subunit alcohol dehydrogenase family)